ncbi:MAG: toprim domain-containing protein [Firmicutes bacterium]|nr:toprim domain-containing protein [Bacillota bacterium]
MDRQEAREQLKGYLREYVESVTSKSRGANMYVCPLCGSGSGAHGTGAFSIKNSTSWKCFRCNAGGDIFDLYGAINNTADHNAQLQGVAELYGVKVDGYRASAQEDFSPAYQNQPKAERNTHNSIHTTAHTQEQETDYTGFFLQANRAVEQTDYWAKRGLSRETVDRFKLGFVAEWKHPKAPKAPATPRLIIPTSRGSYLARDTRDPATIPAEQKGYTKSKVGHIQLFNKRALQEADKPIFVVEGELDALSIIEVGGVAIALGTTTKSKALVELAKAQAPVQPLIIALDNDEVGQKASRELTERLQALNIPCYGFNPCGQYKDANEALQRDREGFTVAVAEAETLQDEAEQAKKDSYLKTSTANYLQSFVDGIADSVDTPYIPTGFSELDGVLDGGLYEGLYIVGAISSLGKTTLIVQICDQIAQAGHDALIFSLEMARTELMAKSISRHTLQTVLATGGDIRNAKTARGITTGKRYMDYSQTERELINSSILEYGKYAQNIYISEGVGDIGVEQIRETVKQHILYTGKTPIVAVDYLQILAPSNERATDKQNTDKAVMELKRISRDYKTPVIGLSSFNRANYKEAVTMEAFKESGAIEYSSDILIGLQLKGAGEKNFDANEAKRKDPREVELVILKNRNGRAGDKLSFFFYPLFNYFKEECCRGELLYSSKRTL